MPLPSSPLVANGGCNCGAIRFKISIPELEKRPLHPFSTSSNQVSLPFVCTDHCNDCRRATGSVLPSWICTPIDMVTASVVLRSEATSLNRSKVGEALTEKRNEWLDAKHLFKPGPLSSDSFLTFYKSSEGRLRSFCGRCGTNLAYRVSPMPSEWPDMLDIVLGTLDRQDLDTPSFTPERQLWWNYGLDWTRKMSNQGMTELPKHPSYMIHEVIDEGK